MGEIGLFIECMLPVARLLLDLAIFFAFWIFAFNPLFLLVEGRSWVERTAPSVGYSFRKVWLAWARKLAVAYGYLACAVLGVGIVWYLSCRLAG